MSFTEQKYESLNIKWVYWTKMWSSRLAPFLSSGKKSQKWNKPIPVEISIRDLTSSINYWKRAIDQPVFSE